MKISRLTVLRQIRPYTRPLKGSLILLILLSAAAFPVTLISPRFFQILVDEVLALKNWPMFWVVATGLLSVYALRLVIDGGSLFFGNRLLNRFSWELRSDVFQKYERAPFAFLEKRDAGDLKMRVMDDVDSLGSFLKSQVVDWLSALLMAIFTLAMCLTIQWQMTLYCLCALPVVFLINYAIGRGSRKVNEEIRAVQQEYYTSTHNSLQFWKEIKAQCAEGAFLRRFQHYRAVLARLGLRSIRYWAYGEIFSDFKANYLTRVMVYVVGAFFVIRGSLTVGVLMMFAEYFALLFDALDTVNGKNVELRVNSPYYRRIFETLSFPEEPSHDKKAVNLTGAVSVRNVTFAYREGKPVLRDVNLTVQPGDYLAVIGKTGCGKTTLAKLLLGLYPPQAGEIRLDGVPLNDIDRTSLTAQIGVVMQDSYLFDTSIAENLRLTKPGASEEDLTAACAQANILEFIRSLPEGFDTVIGERGVRLSGGQKQRLCIARALLKQPKILLLDEATSALDRESEDSINRSINEIARSMTVLVIAHKPATVLRARRVVVMDDGRVADSGSHEDLLVRNGFYQQLAAG